MDYGLIRVQSTVGGGVYKIVKGAYIGPAGTFVALHPLQVVKALHGRSLCEARRELEKSRLWQSAEECDMNRATG